MSQHIYSTDHKNALNSGGNLYFSWSVLHKEGLSDVPQFILEISLHTTAHYGNGHSRIRTARFSMERSHHSITVTIHGVMVFAGGSVYDIPGNHSVCVQEVYKRVHVVIDAINSCESFDIVFPESEVEQQKLVDEKHSRLQKLCWCH